MQLRLKINFNWENKNWNDHWTIGDNFKNGYKNWLCFKTHKTAKLPQRLSSYPLNWTLSPPEKRQMAFPWSNPFFAAASTSCWPHFLSFKSAFPSNSLYHFVRPICFRSDGVDIFRINHHYWHYFLLPRPSVWVDFWANAFIQTAPLLAAITHVSGWWWIFKKRPTNFAQLSSLQAKAFFSRNQTWWNVIF